ncbi:cytochrome P450 [Xylaria sp. CBS 124048]|nr:cytochrome P450 [Xylaria sp. CBS 124048]
MASIHPSTATADRSWMKEVDIMPHLPSQPLPCIVTIVLVGLLAYYTWNVRLRKLPPILNAPGWFDMGDSLAKLAFQNRAAHLLEMATEQFGDQPVRITTDTGNIMILPPNHLAREIRNNKNLSRSEGTREDFHGELPGFEVFNPRQTAFMVLRVTENHLKKNLQKVTGPVSSEASFALKDLLGDSKAEWKEVSLTQTTQRYISRLSARIFLGEELCRNKDWPEVTSQYITRIMIAVKRLRIYPRFMRSIVHWFHPDCRAARTLLNKARAIIEEDIKRRRTEKMAAEKEGRPIPAPNDAVEWAEEESKNETYDPAVYQIALALASIHTTTDLLSKTLRNLIPRPELIDALRKEAIEVLQSRGMTKMALAKLKLMDSVFKETQRLAPLRMTTMHRLAVADVTLSDGTVIRKGTRCAVRSSKRMDPTIYGNPTEFDGSRFLRMREVPGKETQASLVTTSVESLGFGYGAHVCPGRFFAAHELKIALIHLLLKYDFKFPPNYQPKIIEDGFDLKMDPKASILVRRREAELDVDSLSMNE